MRVLLGAGLGIVLAACWFVPALAPGQGAAKEDAEVLALFNKLTQAFADRDAKKFAALWSETAEYFGEDEDEALEGRKAIEADFAARFAKTAQARLEIDITRLRCPGRTWPAWKGLPACSGPRRRPAGRALSPCSCATRGAG